MKLTYTYKCNSCEKEFEVTHGMNEEVIVECEKCGSKDVKRIYSVPSFRIDCEGFVGKIGK